MKFKKIALLFIGGLLIGAAVAFAATTWHTADSAAVGWDAVTEIITSDGPAPLPEGSTIEYEISICDAIVNPDNSQEWIPDLTTAQLKWTGTDLNCVVTAEEEGRYFFGGQSFRIIDGERVSKSEQVWTSNPVTCKDGEAFGFQYFLPPANMGGFK